MTASGEYDDLIETLRRVEERLRELVYERLRTATEEADEGSQRDAIAEEKRLQKARRGVERAIVALGGQPED